MKEFVRKMTVNNITMTMEPCPVFHGMSVRFLKDGAPLVSVSRIIDTTIFENSDRVVAVLEDLLDRCLTITKG